MNIKDNNGCTPGSQGQIQNQDLYCNQAVMRVPSTFPLHVVSNRAEWRVKTFILCLAVGSIFFLYS